MPVLSNKLKALILDWDAESEHYKRVEKRWLNSVSSLSSLNSEIYNLCKAEGVDIKSLNLSKET